MTKINCIIVDDEPLAIRLITAHVNRVPQLNLLASFENPTEALAFLREHHVDLLLLDIQMPVITGLELARMLPATTRVIFTTAYREFAVESYELQVVDYLLKPIKRTEFINTIERVQKEKFKNQKSKIEKLLSHLKVDKSDTKIVLATQEGMHFLDYEDIMYVKGDGAYTHYHCADGSKYLISKTLKDAESKLTDSRFKRVHASYIINFDFVKKYQRSDGGYFLLKNGTSIPVSRSKKQELLFFMEKWQ